MSSWYTGGLWVGCYIWYSEEGTGQGRSHQPGHRGKSTAIQTSWHHYLTRYELANTH